MKNLLLALCAVSLTFAFSTSVCAQDFPFATPTPLVEGVTQPKYNGLRVGDVAPEFTLPDGSTKLWSSRERLGQKAILLVLVGESPVLVGKASTPELVTKSIVDAASQLTIANVETVVISKATGISVNGINAKFDALCLKDADGVASNLYSLSPTSLTLVAIDRAGFLRYHETVASPADVGKLMIQLGDTTPKLEIGKPAPDFAISDMNGHIRRLSDLRGRKNLLLTFFPKCFTGGCANHLTSLNDNFSSFSDKDTDVIGVSVDPADGERGQIAFASSLELQFPLVPDTGRNLSLLYEAARRSYSTAYRRTMFIDKDGILRFVDKNINVFTHGTDALDEMKTVGIIK